MRELTVGDVPVRALRVTFVGELGWELYCPTEYGAGLWRTCGEAGREHGLRRRRLPRDRLAAPGEGLPRVGGRHHARRDAPSRPAWASASSATAPFLGAEALAASTDAAPAHAGRRLRCLALEDPRSVALGNEPVRVGGEIVGRVTSGGYGYTVRTLDRLRLRAGASWRLGASVEVDIFGEWVAGEIAREPLFDPRGERVREK